MDLGDLTFETASPLAGTTFEVELPGGGRTTLRLDAAESHERPGRPVRGAPVMKRTPFALYFLGPPSEVLPQGSYTLRSEHVTFASLFIVPVGRDAEATEYQAVFT